MLQAGTMGVLHDRGMIEVCGITGASTSASDCV